MLGWDERGGRYWAAAGGLSSSSSSMRRRGLRREVRLGGSSRCVIREARRSALWWEPAPCRAAIAHWSDKRSRHRASVVVCCRFEPSAPPNCLVCCEIALSGFGVRWPGRFRSEEERLACVWRGGGVNLLDIGALGFLSGCFGGDFGDCYVFSRFYCF